MRFTLSIAFNVFLHSLFGLLILSAGSFGEEASRRRPNIILVMPAAIGYGDLACLGNPVVQTPNLDHFHAESVRFTDFHVSPTAVGSQAALLTGRHEFRSGVTQTIPGGDHLRLDAVTVAQALKQAGYATGFFGAWALGDETNFLPNKRGFDEFLVHAGGSRPETSPVGDEDAPDDPFVNPALLHNGEVVKTQGFGTDIFFARALEWMDDQIDAHVPFFACVFPDAAGQPLACPLRYERRYAGNVPPKLAAFFGLVSNLDENFGHVLEKLDEWGMAKETLVIFMTGDGSTAGVSVFNAGMRGGMGSPYEGGTRVPSFWRWPAGFAGGFDVPALTAHLDVFPTLLEITGAGLPRKIPLEGQSLLPLLQASASPWPERLLFTHAGGWKPGATAPSQYVNCSVRSGRYSLVNNSELYDLQIDPAEAHDTATEHPDEAEKLRHAYDQWWSSIQPGLVSEEPTGEK